MKKTLGCLKIIFITITILFLILNVTSLVSTKIIKNEYPVFFNYTYFICKSESMNPVIEIDDLVIVKMNTKIKENDIITYKQGDTYITHRVIKIDDDENTVVAKGDQNNIEDAVFTKDQIVGRVVYVLKNTTEIIKIILNPIFIVSIMLFSVTISILKNKIDAKTKEVRDSEKNEK